MAAKKMAKKKSRARPKKGKLKIVLKGTDWHVYEKDGSEVRPWVGELPPVDPPEAVIIVQHVTGSPEGTASARRKGKGHSPDNRHGCHKTIYVNGVPYLVHC